MLSHVLERRLQISRLEHVNSQTAQNRRLHDEHKTACFASALTDGLEKHIFTRMAVPSTHTSYKQIHLPGSGEDGLTDLPCRDKFGIRDRAAAAADRRTYICLKMESDVCILIPRVRMSFGQRAEAASPSALTLLVGTLQGSFMQ